MPIPSRLTVNRQLTKLPPTTGRKKFARACVDSPSQAETYHTKLRDGDIVIAYARPCQPHDVFP